MVRAICLERGADCLHMDGPAAIPKSHHLVHVVFAFIYLLW